MPTDTFTPEPSFDGQALLDSAETWRAAARTAIRQGHWDKVDAALGMSESSYDSGIRLTAGAPELQRKLAEGRALCTVLRSDVELRHWRLPEAETRLDEAYKAFKAVEDGVIGAELWRLTARLAERQGRWTSARAAWKKVVKLTESENEVAYGDALVRLAEVEVIEGRSEKANEVLEKAEQLVRELEDDLLRARVAVVRAAELEAQRMHAAAWEVWQDAQMSVAVAPVDFSGLLKLRMAGTAVWMKPSQAFRLVETGYEALVAASHPDALGLAYQQLAVLALVVRDPGASALACLGARACRGGYDDTSMPMLVQALRLAGFEATADLLTEEVGTPPDLDERLSTILGAAAADHQVAWDTLGSEEAMLAICSSIRRSGPASVQVQVDGEKGWMIDDTAALVRHRATLTWDAPVDTLGKVVPLLPPVAPTPPPVGPRSQQPSHTDPTHRPPRRAPDSGAVAGISWPNLLVGVFSVILFLAGVSAFMGVILIQLFAG